MRERPWTAAARIELIRACGTLNLEPAADALIEELGGDDSAEVRVAAANALGTMKVERSAPHLATAMKDDLDWRVRRRAAVSLAEVAGAGAIDPLIDRLSDPRREVGIEVVNALAAQAPEGDPRVAQALVDRLQVDEGAAPRIVPTFVG